MTQLVSLFARPVFDGGENIVVPVGKYFPEFIFEIVIFFRNNLIFLHFRRKFCSEGVVSYSLAVPLPQQGANMQMSQKLLRKQHSHLLSLDRSVGKQHSHLLSLDRSLGNIISSSSMYSVLL